MSKLSREQLKGRTIFVPQSRIKAAHSNQRLCRYHCTPERGSDTELYGRREEHFTALPLLRYNLQETPCSLCIVKLQRCSSGSMSCLCFSFLYIVLTHRGNSPTQWLLGVSAVLAAHAGRVTNTAAHFQTAQGRCDLLLLYGAEWMKNHFFITFLFTVS